jgi:translation initiation factor 2 subunit 1
MLRQRTGFPAEEELVICTVTQVQPHCVFCRLDEYDRTGLIHISEIAPGRIRNIREYVQEEKKIVCKVLRIDQQKGHIDLSLRRVNEMQRRGKLNEIKQEQLAEKIVEQCARQLNKVPLDVYTKISTPIIDAYGGLFPAFEAVSQGKLALETLGIEKALAKAMTEAILQRIKPPIVEIHGDLTVTSYAPNGIELIRDALMKAEAVPGKPQIRYKGAGIYHIKVTAENYKDAEKSLKGAVDTATTTLEKAKATVHWARHES